MRSTARIIIFAGIALPILLLLLNLLPWHNMASPSSSENQKGLSSSDLAEKNRKYWSENAGSALEKEWVKELSKQIEAWLRGNLDWVGLTEQSRESAKLLDYACGDGMISRTYLPYISKARGLDIAEGMVQRYNAKARADGLPEEKMHAIVCDLLTGSPQETQEEPWKDFDLVGVSGAMHHVTDPLELAKKLLQRMKPGAVLLVVEFVPSSGSSLSSHLDHDHDHGHGHHHGHGHEHSHAHPAAHTINTHGFNKKDLTELLASAGFEDIWVEMALGPAKVPTDVHPSGTLQSIFGRGKKPLN